MPRTTMQAFARSIGVRLFAVVAVGLASILPAFGSPHASQAASDETYVSETYGYAITYPTPDWTIFVLGSGEEDDVLLALQGGGAAEFAGQPANDEDMDACLDSLMTKLQARPKLVDFTLIRRGYTEPDLPGAGAAEMYSYLSGDDQAANVGYFECRELPDGNGFVTIFAASPEEIWEDFVPVFEELMAGFDDGSGSESSNDGPDDENDGGPVIGVKTPTSADDDENGDDIETGLSGSTYTGIYVDFSVTWDDQVWGDPEAENDPDGSWESVGIYSDLAYAYFEAVIPEKADLPISDAASCMDVYTEFIATGDGVSDFAPIRRVELPETSPDAVGKVFGYIYTDADETEYDIQAYAECRQVSDASYLFIRMNTEVDLWEDAIADLEELLANITTGEAALSGETGNAAYAGEFFDFRVEADEEVWTAIEAGEENSASYEQVSFSSAVTFVQMVAFNPAANDLDVADAEACFALFRDLLAEDTEGVTEFARLRNVAVPETSRDAVGNAFSYNSAEDGAATEIYTYIECRPIDGSNFLFIRMNTLPRNWDESVTELEELLAGVSTGATSAGTEERETSGGADLLTAPIWLPRPSQIPGITVGEETRRFRLSA